MVDTAVAVALVEAAVRSAISAGAERCIIAAVTSAAISAILSAAKRGSVTSKEPSDDGNFATPLHNSKRKSGQSRVTSATKAAASCSPSTVASTSSVTSRPPLHDLATYPRDCLLARIPYSVKNTMVHIPGDASDESAVSAPPGLCVRNGPVVFDIGEDMSISSFMAESDAGATDDLVPATVAMQEDEFNDPQLEGSVEQSSVSCVCEYDDPGPSLSASIAEANPAIGELPQLGYQASAYALYDPEAAVVKSASLGAVVTPATYDVKLISALHGDHIVDLSIQGIDTVAALKYRIQTIVGVRQELQDLLVNGAPLSNNSALPAFASDAPLIHLAVKNVIQDGAKRGKHKRHNR